MIVAYVEQWHEQDLQRLRGLRLIDDDFLKVVFDGNIEATELVLNVIMDREDLRVVKVTGQREIKGIEGHSVRLDIMAQDADNRMYDIEVQRQDHGDLPLRARYNSSMMDTVLLPAGAGYDKLVPTYVIFLMERDAVGDNKALHHYVMKDIDSGALLGDERHIMFLNGDYKNNETPLGQLIHDFKCTSPDDMYFDVLAKRTRHFKQTEGGIAQMCKVMEDMRKEAEVIGAIKMARQLKATEDEILSIIKEKYDLNETDAESYMELSRDIA